MTVSWIGMLSLMRKMSVMSKLYSSKNLLREYLARVSKDSSESYELGELRFRALEDYEYPEDYLSCKQQEEDEYQG